MGQKMASQRTASQTLGLSGTKEDKQLTGRKGNTHVLQCQAGSSYGLKGFRVGIVVYRRGDGMSTHWRGIHKGGGVGLQQRDSRAVVRCWTPVGKGLCKYIPTLKEYSTLA